MALFGFGKKTTAPITLGSVIDNTPIWQILLAAGAAVVIGDFVSDKARALMREAASLINVTPPKDGKPFPQLQLGAAQAAPMLPQGQEGQSDQAAALVEALRKQGLDDQQIVQVLMAAAKA